MKHFKLLVFFLMIFPASSLFAQKQIYIPTFITGTGMNMNDPASQRCHCRKVETENVVIFWEAGFGSDPSAASGSYKVDMQKLKQVAEKAYSMYLDSLKFAIKGSSVTDRYKLMIFLLYSTEWAAYGSGQDNLVGSLHVNPAAANYEHVVAHEIGHCFEYITGCDSQGGYRYGFGTNGQGGNGFWEQCAQWMGFKTYPAMQFTVGDFSEYLKNNHLHILHESPRYANYFVQDYWTFKRGKEFMGKLWRDSRRPEDPVETYKRLNSLSQAQFNDEMYEHAARLTTWDIPAIRNFGKNYITRRAQVKMNLQSDKYWRIDTSVCIQNYGYNSIKLNAPSQETTVSVNFRGLAGQAGFRAINTTKGGWRYGFVALLEDGTRVYSNTATANVSGSGTNPTQKLSFTCPDNCVNLWLVVSGSPQEHWRHPWDDSNTNDEQWPYEAQFENTNLLGIYSNPIHDETLTYNINMDPAADYTPLPVQLSTSRICEAFAMAPEAIAKALGSTIIYAGINPDGTLNPSSTANAPGHWFGKTGNTVAWGANAFVFSELQISSLIANIGQYPGRCRNGDKFTIKQALTYKKSETETARVTLIFNITIGSPITGLNNEHETSQVMLYPNPTTGLVNWDSEQKWTLEDAMGREIMSGMGTSADLSDFSNGIYIMKTGNNRTRILKN
jgi:hypothetical protein